MELRGVVEKQLRRLENATTWSQFHCAIADLRAALAEPDLEGAVVEAARAEATTLRWDGRYSDKAGSMQDAYDRRATIKRAVDALDAARRPRLEVRPASSMGWVVVDIEGNTRATFLPPDAERHAKDWAARMNERGA